MEQKVYITKYALTAGILIRHAEVSSAYWDEKVLYASAKEEMGTSTYRIGTEAFYTLEEAKKNAEERRMKKIESLKKQIKKLENLKIEVK